MNRKDRQRKLERAHIHQVNAPYRKKDAAGVPPTKGRRRTLPKRLVRRLGRKVRSNEKV